MENHRYVHRDAKFTSYDLGQNWSWDWCLCFRVRPETEALAYDARTARFTLRYVVERLELAGLETKLFRSVDRGLIFVKIRATALRLKEEAARTEYGLKLEPREVVRRVERGYRDALGQYVWYPRRDGWTLPDVPGRVFNTAIVDSEGQSPFAYEAYAFGRYDRRADVQSAYATYLPSNSIFRGVDRLKLIKSIMEADGKNRGAQIKLGELLAKDALRAAYPLHNAGEVAALTDRWLTYATPPWRMPVDAIKDYYGEKIGTYFHFLGHYTTWLAIAAARAELDRRSAQAAGVGIATYLALLFGRGSGGVLLPLYALFVSLWVTGFLESWKSAEATMAMRWGMSDFKTYEQNRPQFVGREIHSPVTGMPEVYFPRREQLVLRAKSYLVVAAALVALVGAFACVFAFQGYMTARPWAFQMDADQELYEATGRQPGAVMSEVLLAVVVIAACDGFIPVAERLTEYENHRTDSLFENHLIGKVFVFHFIASYAPFFYLALGRDFMPRRDARPQLSPVEEQFRKAEYHHLLGSFGDYAELVIQFGYTTLFVTAFPVCVELKQCAG
ncbi:intracellular chloride channel [Aureococcus anophagefferens]|nr:intracellular chloride channel [Aureococcus anophagefferens]